MSKLEFKVKESTIKAGTVIGTRYGGGLLTNDLDKKILRTYVHAALLANHKAALSHFSKHPSLKQIDAEIAENFIEETAEKDVVVKKENAEKADPKPKNK